MQKFECTGLWWLPRDETARVTGTLRVDRDGSLALALVGALGPVDGPFQNKSHPIILGSVERSPFGNDITLTQCALAGSTTGSFAETRERYHASRGFFGALMTEPSALAFTQLSLRLGGLAEWAHVLSGFDRKPVSMPQQGESAPLATYTWRAPLTASIPGARFTLGVALQSRHGLHDYQFHEDVQLNVSCETPKSPDELNNDYVYPLQNLLTFVSDRPQEVERFNVQPDLLSPYQIEVVGARVQPEAEEARPEEEKRRGEAVWRFEMLFTLEDVDFADLVGRWMRLSEVYSAACNLFFGLQYGPPAYIDMMFPAVVQSLNLYFAQRERGVSRRANEEQRLKKILAELPTIDAEWIIDRLGTRPYPPFPDVLRELLSEHSEALNPLVSDRQGRFINEVMNTLHYVTHREPEVGLAACHGADLYWIIQKLRFLLKACFLSELGFSAAKVRELFDRNRFYQHMRRLEASREAIRSPG
jgi:hypothetical protein